MAEVKLKGAKELEKILLDLGPRAGRNALRGSIFDMAREIRDEARKRAPKRTGNLRKAIIARRRRGRPGEERASVDVKAGRGASPDAYYWRFVEYGTSKMAPRPFIRPAFDRLQQGFEAKFGTAIGKRIERALKKK